MDGLVKDEHWKEEEGGNSKREKLSEVPHMIDHGGT